MKKSKILMPLTGIAAIGAIAPVVVLTACHKNEYNIIDKSSLKVQNDGLVGIDEINKAGTSLTLKVSGKLAKTWEKDHTINASWDGAEPAGKFWKIEKGEAKSISVEVGTTKFENQPLPTIKIDTTKFNEWKTADKEETVTFNITYEEFDKEGGTSLGKQTITYTAKLFSQKYSLPTVADVNAFEGTHNTTSGKTEFTKGWTVSNAVDGGNLAVSYNSAADLVIENGESTAKSTLTIKRAGSCQIGTDKAIKFDSASTEFGATATSPVTFKYEGEEFTVTLNFTGTKYVKPSWSQEVKVAKNSTFKITKNA